MNVVASSSQVATQLQASRSLQCLPQQPPTRILRNLSGSSRSRGSCKVLSMSLSASPTAVKTQRVTFQSRRGESLVGEHTLPDAKHAVLLQHGYASNKDGFHLQRIAQTLAQGGVGSLRFDFSGNGESSGTFKFANYAAEVEEMEDAVDFVNRSGSTVIGILGHSKAGTEVIQYGARHDSRDLSIVNVCGRFNLKEGIKERFSAEALATLREKGSMEVPHPKTGKPFVVTQQEMDARTQIDMGEVASAVQLTHVLTIHGTADDTIPIADASEFGDRIRKHTLQAVEGADHRFSEEQHATEITELVARFFIAASARAVMRGR